MSKEELIQLLKDYKENRAKLNIKLKELKNCRIKLKHLELETNSTTSYGINQDIHSKNKISNKVLDKIEKNDTKRIELQKEIEDLEKTVRELREKVEAVDDRLEGLYPKERTLLTAYYIENRTYEEIGNKTYFQLYNQTRSWETIKKIIEKATNKMIKI